MKKLSNPFKMMKFTVINQSLKKCKKKKQKKILQWKTTKKIFPSENIA